MFDFILGHGDAGKMRYAADSFGVNGHEISKSGSDLSAPSL